MVPLAPAVKVPVAVTVQGAFPSDDTLENHVAVIKAPVRVMVMEVEAVVVP
jgi:hypothetical protein